MPATAHNVGRPPLAFCPWKTGMLSQSCTVIFNYISVGDALFTHSIGWAFAMTKQIVVHVRTWGNVKQFHILHVHCSSIAVSYDKKQKMAIAIVWCTRADDLTEV